MDNDELIEGMRDTLEDDTLNDATKRAILVTDIIEISKMSEGDNETTCPMTAAEMDAFFDAEDEALKEDRDDVPVAAQLEDDNGSQSAS